MRNLAWLIHGTQVPIKASDKTEDEYDNFRFSGFRADEAIDQRSKRMTKADLLFVTPRTWVEASTLS